MSQSSAPEPTVDLPGRSSHRVLHDFESAWKLVLDGPTHLETYLAQFDETERDPIRRELQRLDSEYRKLLTAKLSGSSAELGSTMPPISGISGDPSTDAAPPVNTDTVNESQGVIIGGGLTVDEASGKVIPTNSRETKSRPVVPGYQILGELGRGGMGVVYRAHHMALNRVVALKMILAGAHVDEDQLTRFYTEARAVAHLQHVNVVQVFEINEYDGLPYFSLEYVEGGSLSRKINRNPLPIREAAGLAELIARGIFAAHEKGLIHRDLKPANILLTKEGTPKITDFGLARRLEGDAGQTRSGSVLGTPNYMPPEQARGEIDKVGPLADVYSSGAILYEMLTGKPPFQGANILETLEQVQSQEPVPPMQLNAKVPKDLDTICLKCLQKDPTKRYASAKDLADDLRRFLEGRPITARPISTAERVWRLCMRNKVVSGLSAATSLLILGVAIGAPIVAWQLNNQNIEITKQRDRATDAEEKEHQRAEEAIDARKKETKARGEADNDVLAALTALRFFILQFQDELKGRLDLLVIRKRLTQVALREMEKLSRSVSQRTVTDRSTAGAHARLGDLFGQMGEPAKSKPHFEKSFAILENLAKEDPTDPNRIRNLAAIFNKRGDNAFLLGDSPTARKFYEQGLKLRQDWWKLDKGRDSAQQSIAESYSLLGNLALKTGDSTTALKLYRQAEQAYAKVPIKVLMGTLASRQELAALQTRLGQTSLQSGDLKSALKHFNEALARQDNLVKITKGGPGYRRDLAFSRCDLGDLELVWKRQPFAAVQHFQRAVADLRQLLALAPLNSIAKQDLAYGEYRLATALLHMAMISPDMFAVPWAVASRSYYEHARMMLEEVIKLDPTNTDVQTQLLLARARCGMRSETLALIDTLRKQSPKDPRSLFFAGCGYALCIGLTDPDGQAQQTELAINTIEQAVAQGWKDRLALERDPDLESIRGHARFLALLEKMRSKVSEK